MLDHHSPLFTTRNRGARGRAALCVATLIGCMGLEWSSPARAQPAGDAFAAWKDVELSPQFKEVVTSLKGGGLFDDAARDFIDTVILPQLDKDENLPTLEDVRKKIRDRFLQPIGNNNAFEQASMFIRDRLDERAHDAQADLFQRVNAMIFIGEMTDKGRIPWAPALDTLAKAAQDRSLDPAVRMAAVAGISTHLSYLARLTGEQVKSLRLAVAATVPSLLPEAKRDPPVAGETRSPAESWLVSRGMGMLPEAVNPAPPDIASRLNTVIDDASWPFDVRIRAAAALGKTVGPESGIDARKVVASISEMAIAALEADRLHARHMVELRSLNAGGGGPGQPAGSMRGNLGESPADDGLSVAVCRRAAWRLYTLGDAIVPDSKRGGLAALIDKDDAKPGQLASLLKEKGQELDAEPSGQMLLKALDRLDPAGAKRRAADDGDGDASAAR